MGSWEGVFKTAVCKGAYIKMESSQRHGRPLEAKRHKDLLWPLPGIVHNKQKEYRSANEIESFSTDR